MPIRTRNSDARLVILHFFKNEERRITAVTFVDPFSDEQAAALAHAPEHEARFETYQNRSFPVCKRLGAVRICDDAGS
jgi:hypothetical protein